MLRRSIVAMLGLSLARFLMPQVSLAVDEHISKAIEYSKLAIEDRQYARADGLAEDAEMALTYARPVKRLPLTLTVRTSSNI